MDDNKSTGVEPELTHKPQRYSKRLSLMSAACSASSDDHHSASLKLRSHTRLLQSGNGGINVTSPLTTSSPSGGTRSSRKCSASGGPTGKNVTSLSSDLRSPECWEQSERKAEDVELVGEGECTKEKTSQGGSDSSLLKSIIASSSCSPPTNKTNELSQQAGLGGISKPKTTTTTSSSSSSSSSCVTTQHCPLVRVSSSLVTRESSNIARSQMNNDQHCSRHCENDDDDDDHHHHSETRSSTSAQELDNEMCQEAEEREDSGRSCELPVQATAPSTTSSSSSRGNTRRQYPNLNSPRDRDQDDHEEEEEGTNCRLQPRDLKHNFVKHGDKVKISDCSRDDFKVSPSSGEVHCASVTREGDSGAGKNQALVSLLDDNHSKRCKDSKSNEHRGKRNDDKVPTHPKPMSIIVMPEMRIDDGGLETDKCDSLKVKSCLVADGGLSRVSSCRGGKKTTGTKKTSGRVASVPHFESLSPPVPPPPPPVLPGSSKIVLRNKVQLQNNSYNTRGGSGVGDTSKAGEVTEQKKTNFAPMLLMNNLPYMGELTFDTRPRRGRKPKKADICHLISKNYGIQFPVSYINLPNTGSGPPPPTIIHPPPPPLTSKSSHSKRTNHVVPSGTQASAPGSKMLPPPAFSNRDVSIVPIPSNWGGTAPEKCSQSSSSASGGNTAKQLSLAQQLMLHPSSSQQSISMFPLPSSTSQPFGKMVTMTGLKSEDENEQEGDDEPEDYEMKMVLSPSSWTEDIPLNLCLRDSSRELSQEPLSLCKTRREGDSEKSRRNMMDVRWNKGVLIHGATNTSRASSSTNIGSVSMSSYGKRNISVEGGKGSKSAKYSTRTNSSSSFASSSNNCGDDDVSTLVNQHKRLICPTSSYSLGAQPNFSVDQGNKHQSAGVRSQSLSSSSPVSVFPISHPGNKDCGSSSNNITNIGSKGSLPQIGNTSMISEKGSKQSGIRKKRDISSTSNLRGDISISASPSPHHSGAGGSAGVGSSGTNLSSISGTLFGQSTSGMNDAAEVSICKFKFTGGAKPCLQEKKMLSVDSGGNFRFYTDKTSGPANKVGKSQQYPSSTSTTCSSSTNQSKSLASGSSPGDMCTSAAESECHFAALSSLPKSAKSMSMCMSSPGNSSAVHVINSPVAPCPSSSKSRPPSRLSLPLLPSASGSLNNTTISISPTTEELNQLHLMDAQCGSRSRSSVSPFTGEYSYSSSNSCSSDNSNENPMGAQSDKSSSSLRLRSSYRSSMGMGSGHGSKMKMKRKRKTRKSLMREKLEKTFKEKGFLIQTQQLESAEGATYCKFRQLRKFTRYLFRSWKDYLPDHVKDISDNNNGEQIGQQVQQRMEDSAKNPLSICPSRKDSRCSTTSTMTSANIQNLEMDSNDFVDDDEEDDGDEDDDDDDEDKDPEEHDGMISDDNNNGNDERDNEGTNFKQECVKVKEEKDHCEEDDEGNGGAMAVESSHAPPQSTIKCDPDQDEEEDDDELQVDT